MRRIAALCAALVLCLCSCGTAVTVDTDPDGGYSRENVAEFTSSVGFGYRRTVDDVYTVLEYVYNDEELAERFGGAFEVEDVSGGFEGKTQYLPFFWEGEGRYAVVIDGIEFSVTVEKPLFGKLEVTAIEENRK